MSRERGFTLLEVLLSVTVIGMLVGISMPIYKAFVQRNDLDIAVQNLTSALRRAQTYARAMENDSPWSVEVQSGVVTLFQGANFATRDPAFDEVISLPGSITPSGLGEVQFAKFTSAPNTTGGITLTSTTSDIRTITINAEGMVDY